MQHVSGLSAVSSSSAKASALAAYDVAVCDPASADWQAVAHMLRASIPAAKARAAGSDGSAPRWWADWKLGKVYSLDSLEVLFSDGVRVRCNIAQAPGKLPRIAAACRVAIGFYRARTRSNAVPSFAHVENVSDGETFDAAACSRLTADLRAASYGAEGPRKPVTTEAVERMAREVERRRSIEPHRDASSEDIAAAVRAGEDELAGMRAALISDATIVGPEINSAPCDDAGPATETENPADLTTCELAQNRKLTGHACLKAVEPHASEATDALEPRGSEASAAPAPVETHTIIAVCTSHRGREKLFERIQDGCFAADRQSYHGAYRITLQDAEEIGSIRGVRFVGMPRKPRSSPMETAPAPVAVSAPAFACRSLARALSGSVTFHATHVL